MMSPSEAFAQHLRLSYTLSMMTTFERTYFEDEPFSHFPKSNLLTIHEELTAFLSYDWLNLQSKEFDGLKTYLGELRAFLGIEVEKEEIAFNSGFMDDLKEGVKYDPEGCQIFTSTGKHLLDLRGISRLTDQYGEDSNKTALYLDGFGYWLTGLINREVEQQAQKAKEIEQEEKAIEEKERVELQRLINKYGIPQQDWSQ